jgi:hypothetical protein
LTPRAEIVPLGDPRQQPGPLTRQNRPTHPAASKRRPVGLRLAAAVALTRRLRADQSHAPTLAGQCIVRAAPAGAYWTNDFTLGFAEAPVSTPLR